MIFMVLLVVFLWYVLNYTAWVEDSMPLVTIRKRQHCRVSASTAC